MTEQASIDAIGTVRRRRRLALERRDLIFLAVAGIMIVMFLSRALTFGLIGNLQILAIAMSTIGIVAAGQTLVVITGGIDLSVGSLVALTGVITAVLVRGIEPFGPFPPLIASLVGLAIATGIGWAQGTLIGYYKLAPFIVTFGALSLLRGTAQVISHGSPVNVRTNAFDWLWSNAFGLIPVPAIIMLVVFVVMAAVLRYSRFGRYAYAIGSNENVAHLSGINVMRMRQLVYAISGFLAGVAGLLIMSRIRGGTYGNGQGYELITIAAVIIGGTSLAGGTGGVWGTLIGVLVITMIGNSLVLFSVPPLWNDIIIGAFIVGAALIDLQRRRQRTSTIIAPPPLPPLPIHTLEHALNRLACSLAEQYGYTLSRVYLLDRTAETLLDPHHPDAPVSTLAQRAAATRSPLILNDLRREHKSQVIMLQPDVQAAAAVPFCVGQQLVGVLELQHRTANTFAGAALNALISPAMAAQIERNWLLESGWLTQQVRESLRHLTDRVYLEKCPLGDWLLPATELYRRGERLRDILRHAIESLHAEEADPQSRAVRRYHILRQTYLDQKHVDGVIHDLGLSRRQYFYDLKEAVEAATHYVAAQR
jgi:ribose/xylose/arabinose/galactoside ABC-type transport system permease subunit